MEQNPAAVECLICFYINANYLLKAKLLDANTFLSEMIKHCKERGFYQYSDKEITNAWKRLVSKYMYLKAKAETDEKKENWKYFNILDSCYEHSDFQNGRQSKYSEDMVWFLIECLLKRKGLEKTQKRSKILSDIHKEFVQHGYLHITKHDIENKWKNLKSKYDKLKNYPDRLNKHPHLQTLRAYYEENEKSLVNMAFTQELTDNLIEWYTEKKISCVIHGYDSAQVLSEIQSKFAEKGYYFSIEAIRDKWKKLVAVYEYLSSKAENQTTWIYFSAMRNHFNRNYLLSTDREVAEIIDRGSKSKARHRSKSVGVERARNRSKSICSTEPGEIIVIDDEEVEVNETKNAERSFETSAVGVSRRKRGRPRKIPQSDLSDCSLDKQCEVHLPPRPKSACALITRSNTPDNKRKSVKRPVNGETFTPLKKLRTGDDINLPKDMATCSSPNKDNQNQNGATNTVQKVNADSTNVSERNVTSTKTLPPVTLWDVELLPFKKRLRTDKQSVDSESDVEGTAIPVVANRLLGRSEDERSIEQLSELEKESLSIYLRKGNDWHRQNMPAVEHREIGLLQSMQNKTKNQPFGLFVQNLKIAKTTNAITDSLNDSAQISDGTSNEVHAEENLTSHVQPNQAETRPACNDTEISPDLLDGTHRADCNTSPPENGPVCLCCIDLTNNEDNEGYCMKKTRNEHCYSQTGTRKASKSEFEFRKPSPVVQKSVEATETSTGSLKTKNAQTNDSPVPVPKGKVRQILISRKELSKLVTLGAGREAGVKVRQSLPGFKYFSQIVRPGTVESPAKEANAECSDTTGTITDSSRVPERGPVGTNEEFESESVASEAPGEGGLKNSLLSTVTEFQEHNNLEFVEIKNLMQQNNLLQRETNRLLRLLLEKM